MTEFEYCGRCGYEYLKVNKRLPCFFDDLIEDYEAGEEDYWCDNDYKCEHCKHWERDLNTCSIYEELDLD